MSVDNGADDDHWAEGVREGLESSGPVVRSMAESVAAAVTQSNGMYVALGSNPGSDGTPVMERDSAGGVVLRWTPEQYHAAAEAEQRYFGETPVAGETPEVDGSSAPVVGGHQSESVPQCGGLESLGTLGQNRPTGLMGGDNQDEPPEVE